MQCALLFALQCKYAQIFFILSLTIVNVGFIVVTLKVEDATTWPWPSRDWPWPQIDAYLDSTDFPREFRGNTADRTWWPAEFKKTERDHVKPVSRPF